VVSSSSDWWAGIRQHSGICQLVLDLAFSWGGAIADGGVSSGTSGSSLAGKRILSIAYEESNYSTCASLFLQREQTKEDKLLTVILMDPTCVALARQGSAAPRTPMAVVLAKSVEISEAARRESDQ